MQDVTTIGLDIAKSVFQVHGIERSMRLRSRYMRLFQRILALRLDLGGMQERMPASCRLARMIGDWYLRKIEKQPNEVQTI